MEIYLDRMDTLTIRFTIVFKKISAGINPSDNEEGTKQSLKKLARYLGGH